MFFSLWFKNYIISVCTFFYLSPSQRKALMTLICRLKSLEVLRTTWPKMNFQPSGSMMTISNIGVHMYLKLTFFSGRLCQSEMAKKCANLLRTLHSLQSGVNKKPLTRYSPSSDFTGFVFKPHELSLQGKLCYTYKNWLIHSKFEDSL